MAADLDLLRVIERAPLRTIRFADVEGLRPNVWRILNRLVDQGAVVRLAHGIYTAPPGGRDGRTWVPGLETAGLAIASARHGARAVALMGVSAARHWGAIPRAIASATVAVSGGARRPVEIVGGTVYFIERDINRLDVIVDELELGSALVTTPAQTLYDLLMRPDRAGQRDAALEGARNLAAQVDARAFDEIVTAGGRANSSVRSVLRGLSEAP